MSGVEDQGLVIGHFGQVLHRNEVLGPVLKDGAITAVGDKFVGVLSNAGVEVIGDHQHNSGRLFGFVRVFADRSGFHFVLRAVSVHINSSVGEKFLEEFGGEGFMLMIWEVSECISQGQGFFLFGQDIFPDRCVVDFRVERSERWQVAGEALEDGGGERGDHE